MFNFPCTTNFKYKRKTTATSGEEQFIPSKYLFTHFVYSAGNTAGSGTSSLRQSDVHGMVRSSSNASSGIFSMSQNVSSFSQTDSVDVDGKEANFWLGI